MRRAGFGMLGLALTALALGASPARATVGGETLCLVLGWDSSEHRVYVYEQTHDAGNGFGLVAYLPIDGPDAGKLLPVPWSRTGEGTANDPELNRRLRGLRDRLQPMRRVLYQCLPGRTEIVARDSVPNDLGVSLRLRVRASFGGDIVFEVTAYGSDLVARPVVWGIPGRQEEIWVIAFIGDPFESGYETQVPMLVKPGDSGIRMVEWKNPRE